MQLSDSSSRKRKDSAANSIENNCTEVMRPPSNTPPRRWNVWEDVRLIVAARRYNECQWKYVAREVGNGRNYMQVIQRWKTIIEPAFSEMNWSETHDSFLRSHINEMLGSGKFLTATTWRQLAAHIPFRSASDVEARWYNYLASDEQKRHHLSNLANNKDERTHIHESSSSLPKQETVCPPIPVVRHSDLNVDTLLPTQQQQPQQRLLLDPPQVESQKRKLHDHRSKLAPLAAEHDGQFLPPFTDASENTSGPPSSTEAQLHDCISNVSDLPYSHRFEPFVLAESKQNQRGAVSEYLKERSDIDFHFRRIQN